MSDRISTTLGLGRGAITLLHKQALIVTLPLLLSFSGQALAYVGPGLGAGTIGVVLGLLGSIFLALFAFFWYPLKRAFFGKKSDDDEEEDIDPAQTKASPDANTNPGPDDK